MAKMPPQFQKHTFQKSAGKPSTKMAAEEKAEPKGKPSAREEKAERGTK